MRSRKCDGWIANHERPPKDRLPTVTGIEARTDQRLSNLEGQTRKIDELACRLTVQEQGSVNLAGSVEELKNSVNCLGTDIRVMREILQGLDPRTSTSP